MDDKDFRIQQLENENAILKRTIADLTAKLLAAETTFSALEAKIAQLTRDARTR